MTVHVLHLEVRQSGAKVHPFEVVDLRQHAPDRFQQRLGVDVE
jgi:hypothetical protein